MCELNFWSSLKGGSFKTMSDHKAVLIVVPPMLVAATPFGASNKILVLSVFPPLCNESLLRVI